MNVKLKAFIVFCLLLSLMLNGCWDRTEVDELAIVAGLGVDRVPGSNAISLTAQVVNPSAMSKGNSGGGDSSGKEKAYTILTSQGKSMFEAVCNFAKVSSRRIYFAHDAVIVLGKDFASSDISDVMDYMVRDRQFRGNAWMLVADKTAREVLDTKLGIEKLPAEGLQKILMNLQYQALVYPINRREFLRRMSMDAQVSFVPLVEVKAKQLPQAGEQQDQSKKESDPDKEIRLEKTAVFKNNRLIGLLNTNESRGLLWLTGKLHGGLVQISYPSQEGEKEVTMDIYQAATSITPHLTKAGISMDIRCTGQASLRENENAAVIVRDARALPALEHVVDKILKERVEQTITAAQQQYNADFVEFAHHIHNRYPDQWHRMQKNWDQVFPGIKYHVTFDITIIKTERINNSVNEAEKGINL